VVVLTHQNLSVGNCFEPVKPEKSQSFLHLDVFRGVTSLPMIS